jgi:uncharacterized protein (UPF0248 family)
MATDTFFVHQNLNTQHISLFLNVPHESLEVLTGELSSGNLPFSTLWFDTSVIKAGLRSQWGAIDGRTHLFEFSTPIEHIQSTLFAPASASKIQLKWENYTIGELKVSAARIGVPVKDLNHFLNVDNWVNLTDITSQWEEIKTLYEREEIKYPLNFDLLLVLNANVKQTLGFSVPKPRVVKEKKSGSSDEEDEPEESGGKKRLNPAHKIYDRVLHDPTVEHSLFSIGYLDRFSGVKEVPFDNYVTLETELFYNTSVPFHRVQYFKYRGNLVWDRKTRLNLIDGNGFLQFDPQ